MFACLSSFCRLPLLSVLLYSYSLEYCDCYRSVLRKLFSTATQFLERQSIATHIALLDKKVLKRKRKYFYTGEGEIRRIIYGVYYVPNFLSFSNFILFFTFPFLTISNFYIIKKSHFENFSRPTSLGNAAIVHIPQLWRSNYAHSEIDVICEIYNYAFNLKCLFIIFFIRVVQITCRAKLYFIV
jgi:hypothetical protein